MRPWLLPTICVAAAGGMLALLFETHRLAEQVGRAEGEVRTLRAALAAVPATPPATPPAAPPVPQVAEPAPPIDDAADRQQMPPVDALTHAKLLLELKSCQAQLHAVTETLQRRNEEQMLKVKASEDLLQLRQPVPEGVRACLNAVHAWLHAEGFYGHRFLTASRLEADGLHDVEMLDTEPDGLGVALLQAERMTATLDRGASRLEFRFFDGFRSVGGERSNFPADGFALTFRDVDGRQIEQGLPFLVHAEGAYLPDAAQVRHQTDVDAVTRRQWMERIEQVLSGAGTALNWRPSHFRGMADGWFLVADLTGTDSKNHVIGSVHCERLAIEVDKTAGIVSLLMQSGSLRQSGVESTITADGFRMLLPKLTAKQATDAMLGMVVIR